MENNCAGLVSLLRAQRDTTPDAWILHAADQIERLARDNDVLRRAVATWESEAKRLRLGIVQYLNGLRNGATHAEIDAILSPTPPSPGDAP